MVLFWFFDAIDLKKCVIAMNTFYFRFFACVKNPIKRTVPRRSRTLARSVRRVIACQSRGSAHPRLSGGSVEKKNSVCYWPEPSRSGLPQQVLALLGSSLRLLRAGRRVCCFLLGCAFRVLPSCGHGKLLCLMLLLSQGLPFLRRVCGAVRRRITSKRHALCIISVHRHVIGFFMSRKTELSMMMYYAHTPMYVCTNMPLHAHAAVRRQR